MSLLEEAHELLKYRNWGSAATKDAFVKQDKPSRLETQRLILQSQLLRYYFNHENELSEGVKYSDLYKRTKLPATRFTSKFNANSLQLALQWISTFITFTDKLGNAVAAYFSSSPKELEYFGRVTFPTVFYHFVTKEFADQAMKFMDTLLSVAPTNIFGECFVGYFLNMPDFCNSVWKLFNENIAFCNDPMLTSNILDSLLRALRSASSRLTDGHKIITKKFYEKDASGFAKYFIDGVLNTLFKESTVNSAPDAEKNVAVTQFMEFLLLHPMLPHVKSILKAVTVESGAKWCVPQAIIPDDNRANISLTCRDCFLIEKIINAQAETLGITVPNVMKLAGRKGWANTDVIQADVTTHTFVKVNPYFTQSVTFPGKEKLTAKENGDFSRKYKAISSSARGFDLDPLIFIKVPPKDMKISRILAGLSSDFIEYMTVQSINESIVSNKLYEEFGNLSFINREFYFMQLQAQLMLTNVYQLASQKCIETPQLGKEKPETPATEAPILRGRAMTGKRKASKILKRLSIAMPSTTSIISESQPILTTACFGNGPLLSNFQKQASDFSLEPSIFTQKANTAHASEFSLDFDEEPVVEEVVKPVKRARRNSAENEKSQAIAIKAKLKQIFEKEEPSELQMWVLFKSIDQRNLTNKGFDKTCDIFTQYVTVRKVQLQEESSTIPEFLREMISEISKAINNNASVGPCASLYFVLQRLTELMQIDEKYMHEVPNASPNAVFNLFLSLVSNNEVIQSYIWYGRIIFIFVLGKASIPRKLSQAGHYLETHINEFLASCPDNFIRKISESRQTL